MYGGKGMSQTIDCILENPQFDEFCDKRVKLISNVEL